MLGLHRQQLDTPCLVIDKSSLLNNINILQKQAIQANKRVRPHVKTHKCTAICKLQIEAGAAGISAAKVSEALVLAKAGLQNTLITSPLVTKNKIATLNECLQYDPHIAVVVDNLQNVAALNAMANAQNKKLAIYIDIDPGIGRTGIAYDAVVDFAKACQAFPALTIQGIQCYAGNLQHIENYHERQQASQQTMQKAVTVKQQLQADGFGDLILTGSGTGTYEIDMQLADVNEIQPGSYTVMDSEYLLIGSKNNAARFTTFAPAMQLLTTVISNNRHEHVTCDAGWKALYQVPTKPIVLEPQNLHYDWGGFGDEHGKITATDGTALPQLGEVLSLMVAHCDPTINLFNEFYVTENDIVTEIWPIDMRGCSQ